MGNFVSEMERLHILLKLRHLVERRYSEDQNEDSKQLDSEILETLNQIRMIEYYIW